MMFTIPIGNLSSARLRHSRCLPPMSSCVIWIASLSVFVVRTSGVLSEVGCAESCADEPVGSRTHASLLTLRAAGELDGSSACGYSPVVEKCLAVVSALYPRAYRRVGLRADQERFQGKVIEGESVVVDDSRVHVCVVLDDEFGVSPWHLGGVQRYAFAWHDDGAWRFLACFLVWLVCEFEVFHPKVVEAHARASDVLHTQYPTAIDCFAPLVLRVPIAGERDVEVRVHDAASVSIPCPYRRDEGQACHDGRPEVYGLQPIHDSSFLRRVGRVVGVAFPSLTRRRKVLLGINRQTLLEVA